MTRLAALPKTRRAFLDMIAVCELGEWNLTHPKSDDGYRVLVGSRPGGAVLFGSYAKHPLMNCPLYVREGLWSTAAGRYQILDNYWPYYSRMLDLNDFGPESQDKYAAQQCKEQNAWEFLDKGELENAVISVNNIWASLPGSPWNQNPKQMSFAVRNYYEELEKYL